MARSYTAPLQIDLEPRLGFANVVDLELQPDAVDAFAVAQAEDEVVPRAAQHGAVGHLHCGGERGLEVRAARLDAAITLRSAQDDHALLAQPGHRGEARRRQVDVFDRAPG